MKPAPRSWLFVPGDDPRKMTRGLASAAEAVILDWEDAVAPSRKAEARTLSRQLLADTPAAGPRRWVRLNGLETPHCSEDLRALPADHIEGVVLPKACGPQSLLELDRLLTQVELAAGLAAGRLQVMAVVTEDAASVLALTQFRQPVPRLCALLWGGEDLAADLGIRSNRGADARYKSPFRLARDLTLMAAAAAGASAIDAVYTDVRDLDGLRQECLEAAADGFTGKAVIHPDQIAVIQTAFEPRAEDLAWARRVVDALGTGHGVAMLDGRMVDRPHLKLARRILGLPDD